MQVRPWLPQAIGEVTYLAMGMADLSVYFPVYQGMSKFPKAFSLGTNEADDESAYWIFRKVQTLAMTDYVRLAPIVKEAYGKYEAALPEKMQEIEKRYLHLLHADEKRAKKYLQKQNAKLINEALSLAQDVLNRLFTAATGNVQASIFFANRAKKD
jgi:dipeptidase